MLLAYDDDHLNLNVTVPVSPVSDRKDREEMFGTTRRVLKTMRIASKGMSKISSDRLEAGTKRPSTSPKIVPWVGMTSRTIAEFLMLH